MWLSSLESVLVYVTSLSPFQCHANSYSSLLKARIIYFQLGPILKKKIIKNSSKIASMVILWLYCLHDRISYTGKMRSSSCWIRVWHYSDVIMGMMASQITGLTIVYSTIYSGADQRKHQSSTSLAFVWGIHWWPDNSSNKWPVTWKMFPFHDIIMDSQSCDPFSFWNTCMLILVYLCQTISLAIS